MIEIMLQKLYEKWNITDHSNFDRLKPTDYPILSGLYELIEAEYKNFDRGNRKLYTTELLQEILLGLHSLCKGSDDSFITFGVKGLLQASKMHQQRHAV